MIRWPLRQPIAPASTRTRKKSSGLTRLFSRQPWCVQKVNLYRGQAEKLLSKIATEARAGHYLFDVLAANDIEFFILLKQGAFAPHISAESKAYPVGFKDPKGFWTDTYNNYHSICYNTRLVSAREAPKDWKDLRDPKWNSEKLALVRNAAPWYANMIKIMGEKEGRVFFRR